MSEYCECGNEYYTQKMGGACRKHCNKCGKIWRFTIFVLYYKHGRKLPNNIVLKIENEPKNSDDVIALEELIAKTVGEKDKVTVASWRIL